MLYIIRDLEYFQLLDNEPLGNKIIERDFTKKCHRRGDQLNQSDQKIEFIFGENNNYHQIGNAYLEFNNTVRKNDTTNFHDNDPIRLVNNGCAYCFEEARLSNSIAGDIEINKFCGQVSTILRVISNKDGDIFFLYLITLTKMIYQFSRDLLTCQPKFNQDLIKKC